MEKKKKGKKVGNWQVEIKKEISKKCRGRKMVRNSRYT
jgi:hypothetical protein